MKLLFKGFKPSKELEAVSRQILHQLEDKSPNSSFCSLVIQKQEDGYLGEVTVCSAIEVFTSKLTDPQPKKLIKKLYKEMDSDLMVWKKQRFTA